MNETLPCINCLTLPICRNYIQTNPRHHPTLKEIRLCRYRISEIKCWDAMDFIYTFTKKPGGQPYTPVKKMNLRIMYRYLKDLKLPNYGEWAWTKKEE